MFKTHNIVMYKNGGEKMIFIVTGTTAVPGCGRTWCCCLGRADARCFSCCRGDDDECLPPEAAAADDDDLAAACCCLWCLADLAGAGAGGTAVSELVSADDLRRNAFSQPSRLECVSAALELTFGDFSFLPSTPLPPRCCVRPAAASPSSAVDDVFSTDTPSLLGVSS